MPAPLPLPGLAELEARAPKDASDPAASFRFHQDVVRLVESNTLQSGDDFFRAANLVVCGTLIEYRSARMHYELMLAAAAKDHREAEKFLPESWDALLLRLGRPMRLDVLGFAANNPGSDDFPLDPAPKVIQDVLRNPGTARDAAGKAHDNAEVQKIVDADQAPRASWNKLTASDAQAVASSDHQRNVRIRQIVDEGGLHTAKDFANASLVMQHSAAFAGYELAHELAVCAMLLGDRGMGRWLVAATYDRMLNSVGHDQRFGTQGALTLMNQVTSELRQVDEAGICDAERVALGCPSLAAKRANLLVGAADALIGKGRFAEAEAFARDGVSQHVKAYPDGDWHICSARRALGASLLGQKKFAEAEPVLLEAYAALKRNEAAIPPHVRNQIREVAGGLVQLYEATNQPAKVREWRQHVADFDRARSSSP